MRYRVACLAAIILTSAAFAQPQQPEAVTRGDAAFQAQNYAQAVTAYQEAVTQGVNHPFLHYRLGYALHVLGRYEEAIPSHLIGARAHHPQVRPACLYNAACAYAKIGDADHALQYLQSAIDIGITVDPAADPDFESLHDDERFKAIVEGIGTAPTLFQQLDFLLGDWSSVLESGEVVAENSFTRTLEGSSAITFTSRQATGGRFAGILYPEPATRSWKWIQTDAMGSVMEFDGVAIDRGMIFTGRERTFTGSGVLIRLTIQRQEDGQITETADISEDDGQTWRTHHSDRYVPLEADVADDAADDSPR